jgi:2'-5' RNA ligase
LRLFIAIDLDEAARAAIAEEQRRLKAAIGSTRATVKWVRPDQMHLTLVFLGEVADARVQAIVEAIDRPIVESPFDLAFAGVGVFPQRGAPNVLWIGASAGKAETIAVQRQLADRVAPLGIPLERRPFHPHLTLARLKGSRPSDQAAILRESGRNVVATTRIDHATLYQSRLSSHGATYTPLARATLSARA